MELAAEELLDDGRRPRAVFMAFGTKGDVFPIASIAAAFASSQNQYHVVFITHLAHQNLAVHLSTKNVVYIPISTPPVLSIPQAGHDSDSDELSFYIRRKSIQAQHRQECLSAVNSVFGDDSTVEGDVIMINFFALEGWHLAELFQVQCVIAAPYVVPYSAPSSFERQFKEENPLLYKYFQEAPADTVSWRDVMHWMWPLFMEDWGSWRSEILNLSPFPFTDPVTGLPMWHRREKSPLLLYGFSKEIVECPGYWPLNIRVCGFWFLPSEWQFSCDKCRQTLSLNSVVQRNGLCLDHADMQHFLMNSSPSPPIFVGLSSMGSMGFLRNPHSFLKVLKGVIERTNYRFILFSAGYEPLEVIIRSYADASLVDSGNTSRDGTLLFDDHLCCFSGSLPYNWLFPRCAAAVHHGGSGSTAAALYAGIPQIICPFIHDQFYWAERLYWLGVSPKPLQKQDLLPDNNDSMCINQATDALARAINLSLSPAMRAQAVNISKRISSEDGLQEALEVFKEKVLNSK